MGNALTTIDKAKVDAVLRDVLDHGSHLRDAIKAQGLTVGQFGYYLQSDREASLAFARAQEFRADLLVDEALHLADGDGDPAKVRNQIDIRKWSASRLNSKRYGDRVDLNVTQTIDVGATLQEARARLSERYQQPLQHVQVIDLPSVTDQRANDTESQALNKAVPDIFD